MPSLFPGGNLGTVHLDRPRLTLEFTTSRLSCPLEWLGARLPSQPRKQNRYYVYMVGTKGSIEYRAVGRLTMSSPGVPEAHNQRRKFHSSSLSSPYSSLLSVSEYKSSSDNSITVTSSQMTFSTSSLTHSSYFLSYTLHDRTTRLSNVISSRRSYRAPNNP